MLIGTLSSSISDCPVIGKDSQSITSEESVDSEQSKTDRTTEFHLQSGIGDKSWILLDSGASANCRPPWFAKDNPLLLVGSDCPALRSISGETLQVLGRRVVELDCNGHSMCVQVNLCDNIPFPLVSVSRFLIQDFWTVISNGFMALMTSHSQTVPIVRHGAVEYLTPTVIPYDRYSGSRTELEICSLTQEIDLT